MSVSRLINNEEQATLWNGSAGRAWIEVQPLLDGSTASFICADAQTRPLEPASYNMIISRFGVMFFADPVSALANLRRAATDDADLCFLAWRSPEENPFMTTAERAAAHGYGRADGRLGARSKPEWAFGVTVFKMG